MRLVFLRQFFLSNNFIARLKVHIQHSEEENLDTKNVLLFNLIYFFLDF